MNDFPEGNAIVYCESAFRTTYGKTAHGLVRRSERYRITAVVDSTCAGQDAGSILDGAPNGVPIVAGLDAALEVSRQSGAGATHLVVGLATDGGFLPEEARADVKKAIQAGLNIDCGLHQFLSEDPEMAALADQHGVRIRDVRKPPPRSQLHFFSGKIDEVKALKVAVLGTDSALGKRTTAWILVDGLRDAGGSAAMVGTGQTAWMQGARHSIVLDSIVNDFVAGEIEHAVWSAWNDGRPEVIVVEGQGSLMNPAYPGGFEILAAARPDIVLLQHAPARKEYDGFPGFPLHPIETQIHAIELLSGKPVVAVTLNHENLDAAQGAAALEAIRQSTKLPAFDVLRDGPNGLVSVVLSRLDTA
jgi:uncharacterized NAD-dependent epimerase/dehydratase family protein